MKRVAALSLSLLACVQTLAIDDPRGQVEQRLRLAARMIADPAMTQRLSTSGNAAAVEHLGQARLQQALAEEALQRNDLASARRAVDEALRYASTARRLVPDGTSHLAAARQRQQQRLATLERLLDSLYGGVAPPEVRDGDVDAALGLMDTARHFAAGGRHDEAAFTLGLAEQHMRTALQRANTAREVDYTQRASTPAQEFKLELQRHDGLVELVPVALRELRPSGAALALVERYGETSRGLREQARQKADGGDLTAALEHIRQASIYVQRALQAAGVSTPRAQGVLP
jgi:hypothetical protein